MSRTRRLRHPWRKKNNKHHLFPKSRSRRPIDRKENLLLIDADVHAKLHMVFGNRTFKEILILLHRVYHAKHYERIEACPFH